VSGPATATLHLDSIQPLPGPQVQLRLSAPANQSCTVLFKPVLTDGPWIALTNYPAAPTNRVIQLVTPAPGGSGFYRLRTP
jgi:hypothetical protein